MAKPVHIMQNSLAGCCTTALMRSVTCAGSASASVATVVHVQDRPQFEGSFPGLYATSLPEQLFHSSETALLTTQWENSAQIAAVNLSDGNVTFWLEHADEEHTEGSWTVLSTYNGKREGANTYFTPAGPSSTAKCLAALFGLGMKMALLQLATEATTQLPFWGDLSLGSPSLWL